MSRWRPISWILALWFGVAVVGAAAIIVRGSDSDAAAHTLGAGSFYWVVGLVVLSIIWAVTRQRSCAWCGLPFSGNGGRCPRCGYHDGMPGVGQCPNCKGLLDVRSALCTRCGFRPPIVPGP